MNKSQCASNRIDVHVNQRLAEESAEWVLIMKDPTLDERASFAAWVTQSPKHIEEFLIASTIDAQIHRIGPARINEVIRRSQCRVAEGLPATEGVDEEALEARLREKYRRSLLQVFLKRHVEPDAAENLIQYALFIAAAQIRKRRFRKELEVAEHLYRLSCGLAKSYWDGEMVRRKALRGEGGAMA